MLGLNEACARGQAQAAPQLQRGFYRVNEQGRPEQQPPSEWTATVDDELPTLAEVFARVPQHIGFDIEVRLALDAALHGAQNAPYTRINSHGIGAICGCAVS